MSRILAFLLLALLPSAAAASAQGGATEESYRRSGGIPDSRYGVQVLALPSLDGAGTPYSAVWGHFRNTGGSLVPGVQIRESVSWNNGYTVFLPSGWWEPPPPSLAVGDDYDGDGVLDFFLGDPGDLMGFGSFRLCSGATGRVIYTEYPAPGQTGFGTAVLVLPDRDGDGLREVAASAPYGTSLGVIRIHSGATGALLQEIALNAGGQFGTFLFSTGDLDGDGEDDWGVRLRDFSISPTGHLVRIYSSVSLQPLFDVQPGSGDWTRFGESGGGIGDLDGDGFEDLAFGALRGSNCVHEGHVFSFSGADGSRIGELTGTGLGTVRIGREIARAGDLDHDGFPDLAIQAQKPLSGSSVPDSELLLVSLLDGRILESWKEDAAAGFLPYALDSQDADGDGRYEFLIGSPLAANASGAAEAGMVHGRKWYDGLNATGTVLSASAGGFLGFRIDFPIVAAGDDFLLLFSASGTGPMMLGSLEVPLTVDALLAQSYFGNYPDVVRSATGVLDLEGDGTAWIFAYPNQLDPALIGRRFYTAVVCSNRLTGWRFSSIARAIEITP